MSLTSRTRTRTTHGADRREGLPKSIALTTNVKFSVASRLSGKAKESVAQPPPLLGQGPTAGLIKNCRRFGGLIVYRSSPLTALSASSKDSVRNEVPRLVSSERLIVPPHSYSPPGWT